MEGRNKKKNLEKLMTHGREEKEEGGQKIKFTGKKGEERERRAKQSRSSFEGEIIVGVLLASFSPSRPSSSSSLFLLSTSLASSHFSSPYYKEKTEK